MRLVWPTVAALGSHAHKQSIGKTRANTWSWRRVVFEGRKGGDGRCQRLLKKEEMVTREVKVARVADVSDVKGGTCVR